MRGLMKRKRKLKQEKLYSAKNYLLKWSINIRGYANKME